MITVTLSACDRLDLLERTLRSFVKHNTHPITEFLIRDDSGLESVWNQTKILMGLTLPMPHRLLPGGQLGQAKSIDRLVEEVKTPYIFHLEDDWEFDRPGFIEDCFKAIEWENKFGWGKIGDFSQVRVRHHDDGSATQKETFPKGLAYHCTNHLFSLNPHLRKTDLIDKFEGKNETILGEWVKEKKLKTLWLKEGYCRHIGGDKPTNRAGTSYHSGVLKA